MARAILVGLGRSRFMDHCDTRRRHICGSGFRRKQRLERMALLACRKPGALWSGRQPHLWLSSRARRSNSSSPVGRRPKACSARAHSARSSCSTGRSWSAWRSACRRCSCSWCRGELGGGACRSACWQSRRLRACSACSCSSSQWRWRSWRRCPDLTSLKRRGWEPLQRISPSSPPVKAHGVCRLASGRAQDHETCVATDVGPWGLSHWTPSVLESRMPLSTHRRASHGTRSMVQSASHLGHIRPGGHDQPGWGGAHCPSHPEDRGEAQAQAQCRGRCRRDGIVHGCHQWQPPGIGDQSKTHRMDWDRDAERSDDCQGKTQSQGGACSLTKGREGQQKARMRSRSCGGSTLLKPLLLLSVLFCMPCGVLGRVADFRQRNIFPLPQISGNTESEPYLHQEWQDWANRGIKALNELSGCANSQFSKKKPTRAQRRVIDSIAKAYRDVGGDFSLHDPPGHSCLQELCTSSHLYETDRSDVQPYAREKVSWPEVKSHPVPLEGCLPHADREWLAAWQEQMLRPMDSHSVEKVQPYTDPILKHNQGEYIGFLKELQDRNMLRFQRAEGHPFMLGIFFVRKKYGKLRLIFDTRLLNQYFNDPPNTDLPSADAFTRLETCENASFYAGSGDLSNAFYTLSVPDDLARRFTLPAIEAGKLGLTHLDGEIVGPGTKLCPYLTVLPMGWSWALHFCQAVMMNAIEISGFSGDRIVGDKRAPVHLSDLHTTCAAGYVDNFLVLGVTVMPLTQACRRLAAP